MNEHYDNGEQVAVSEPFQEAEIDNLLLDDEIKRIITQEVSGQVAQAIWEAVTRFAVEIKAHDNPCLTVDAFCFAAGLFIVEGKSVTQLAKEHGVTKQALDKRIIAVTESLGLPPSRGMKSEQARKNYKQQRNKNGTGKQQR